MNDDSFSKILEELDSRYIENIPSTTFFSQTFEFPEANIECSASDPQVLNAFCDPFNHLADGNLESSYQILLLSRDDFLMEPLKSPWIGEKSWYDSDLGILWFETFQGAIKIEDRKRQRLYFLYDVFEDQYWRLPEFSRGLIEVILRNKGIVSIHGAAIGDERNCLLLPGKGGSGKSSLVASALANGFKSVGDDFLLYNQKDGKSGTGTVNALFRTVNLLPSSPSWGKYKDLPHIMTRDREKHVFYPETRFSNCWVRTQNPIAIVIPTIGDAFAIAQSTPSVALKAILPSTAVLSVQPQKMIMAVTQLVRKLPIYEMTISSDLTNDLQKLASYFDFTDATHEK